MSVWRFLQNCRVSLVINHSVDDDVRRVLRRRYEDVANVDASVEVAHEPHFDVANEFFEHSSGRAVEVIVGHKVVREGQVEKVWTKAMRAQRKPTSCWLRVSTFSHSEVLVAIVDRSALVGARVDTRDVFRCRLWISFHVESWPCNGFS